MLAVAIAEDGETWRHMTTALKLMVPPVGFLAEATQFVVLCRFE